MTHTQNGVLRTPRSEFGGSRGPRRDSEGMRTPRSDSGSYGVGAPGPKLLSLESFEMNLTRSASQLLALQEGRASKHHADSADEVEHLNPGVKTENGLHTGPKRAKTLSLCEERRAGGEGSLAGGESELTTRVVRTAILYLGVFILGLQWGVIGPSLPDLEELTGCSTSYISLVLTGRNIAALGGSALAGFLVDRYNTWFLLGVSELFLGVLFAAAPWGRSLIVLAVCMIPSGIAAGFYDTGVNVAVLRVWDGKPGPWIQGMECIDAIGSFVAPLLVRPFLANKPSDSWEEGAELNSSHSSTLQTHDMGSNVTSDKYSADMRYNDYSNGSDFTVIDVTNHTSSYETIHEESKVMFAYLIVGILLVFTASAHIIVFIKGKYNLKRTQTAASDEDILYSACSNSKQEQRIRLAILPLLFFICFSYYALETGYAHYLMTFCVKYLEWDKSSGVSVTSAFWGSYTAGTAIGIVLIRYVKPRTLLICDVTLCLSSQIVMTIFIKSHPAVIWVCTIVAGLSIATVFASVFSWAQKNIGVTGKVNALMMMGLSLGEMTSPAIIGILMDKSGPISWVYCMLAASTLAAVVVVCMQFLGNKLKRARICNVVDEKTADFGECNVKIQVTEELKKVAM